MSVVKQLARGQRESDGRTATVGVSIRNDHIEYISVSIVEKRTSNRYNPPEANVKIAMSSSPVFKDEFVSLLAIAFSEAARETRAAIARYEEASKILEPERRLG